MEKKELMPYGTYIMIWFGLLVLTGVTIIAASLHFGQWSIMAAIAIATAKGSLVLYIFMNLKREERLFKIMLFLALCTMTVIMVLTFADISFR